MRDFYLIENDIKNILFNKDNKNKSLSTINLKPLLKELSFYKGISQEYLFYICLKDDRIKDFNNRKLKQKISNTLKKREITTEKVLKYSVVDDVIKRYVEVEQFIKPIKKEIKNLYFGLITETEYKQEKDFKADGFKRFLIATPIREYKTKTYRQILI